MKKSSFRQLFDIVKSEIKGSNLTSQEKAGLMAEFTQAILEADIATTEDLNTDDDIETAIVNFLKSNGASSGKDVSNALNIPYQGSSGVKTYLDALLENGTICHNGRARRGSKYYVDTKTKGKTSRHLKAV